MTIWMASLVALASPTHHYEIGCRFPGEVSCQVSAQVCVAEDCVQSLKVECGGELIYGGEMAVTQAGNQVFLRPDLEPSSFPEVTLGPAKRLPKPGQPAIADSWLKLGSNSEFIGECEVRAVR